MKGNFDPYVLRPLDKMIGVGGVTGIMGWGQPNGVSKLVSSKISESKNEYGGHPLAK